MKCTEIFSRTRCSLAHTSKEWDETGAHRLDYSVHFGNILTSSVGPDQNMKLEVRVNSFV